MKEQAVVAFSGISTRVVEGAARKLQANGVNPSAVVIISDKLDRDYFDRLVKHTLSVASYTESRAGLSPTAFLVSGVTDEAARLLEDEAFFPALRRIAIDPAWRNNPSAADRIANATLAYFQNRDEREFTRRASIRREARLLLPIVNSRCKALVERFNQIYLCEATDLGRRIDRDVVLVRSKKAYRIGGVDFAPVENGGKHPIREHSRSDRCRLAAAFRFGAPVPERVEFDISCGDGLRKRTFWHCDGSSDSFNGEPTHVNMRINDDFGFG